FINVVEGKYQVTLQARSFLSSPEIIDIPIISVCAIGPYRIGKSYLLNYLLNALHKLTEKTVSFPTSSTVQAQTRGLWLADKPIFLSNPPRCVLFIDSEGLNSPEARLQHDMNVFILCILL